MGIIPKNPPSKAELDRRVAAPVKPTQVPVAKKPAKKGDDK